MAPGFGSAELFRMIGSFALVLVLMAALLWALRRLPSRMNNRHLARRLQIIETASVGPRQKLALIQVGTLEVLVCITPTQMTSLGQLPEGSHISQAAHATPPANGDIYVA